MNSTRTSDSDSDAGDGSCDRIRGQRPCTRRNDSRPTQEPSLVQEIAEKTVHATVCDFKRSVCMICRILPFQRRGILLTWVVIVTNMESLFHHDQLRVSDVIY